LSSELGVIFGDGNTNFATFLNDHKCNYFCHFYKLPLLEELVAASRQESLPQPYQSPPRLPSLSAFDEENLPETPLLQKTGPSGTKEVDISIVQD